MNDLYNKNKKILSIKEKFAKECPNCFNLLEEFEKKLKLNQYSIGRIEKYWRCLRAIHTIQCKCFNKVEKQDIENLVIRIDANDKWSDYTKRDFRLILKFFYRWLATGNLDGDYPETVKWIRCKIKKNNEKTPEQILTKEEIELMAKNTTNPRDRALILILYESGCRISEFLGMRIKDLVFDQYGSYILVSGKTGWRRVRIMDYSKDLLNWLDSHPFKDNHESYVWINLDKPESRIKPATVNKILKETAKKSGIKKHVHPHAFRHARATHLSRHLPEAIMKQLFGWTNDSKMASVYYHLDGKDVDQSLLKMHGISNEGNLESHPITQKTCPNCGESNSFLSHFCKKCNGFLDLSLAWKEKDELVSRILDELKKDPDFIKKVRATIKKLGLERSFELKQ